jgi:crossover junction endodeoxyribonuclease RuvC
MIVIGFDPGSIYFGVGIIKIEKKKKYYLHSETIKLKEKDFYSKMKTLWKRLGKIYTSFPIDEAAIEEGFLGKNVKSMNLLSKVRGVVLASLLIKNIDLKFYSPMQIKLALTGNGNAAKTQVNNMIKILLNLKERELTNDESDALAIAYCHSFNLK